MNEVKLDKAFSKLKPESIVFVLSYDKANKRPSGMIAAWHMRCSFDPCLLAVALWEKGYTHKLIQQTKEFVVAVPNKKLEKAVMIFGTRHGDKFDKFQKSKVKTSKAKLVVPPLLTEATINFECKLQKEIKAGDHFIFIGKVVAAYVNDGKILFNTGEKKGRRVFREYCGLPGS